jgi:molybdopterin-guanine dinucleotide biosynthesis protein A
MPDAAVAGVILTGGRSRRMGGVIKARQILGGQTLIQHVIDRMNPQVGQLLLSVEYESADYACYGLQQIADPVPGSNGPLGGLLSALSNLRDHQDWLLLAPCDAPFLPLDLGRKLKRQAVKMQAQGCVVRYRSEVQPTFSLWNRRLLPVLKSAVLEQGMGGFKQFLRVHDLAVLNWKGSDISPFFNINDPVSLAEAERLIESGSVVR